MEGYVSAQAMAEKKATHYAFVYYVEASRVVEAGEVGVGFSHAGEKDVFSGQSVHTIWVCPGA
jgi:hypothetical protein